MNEIQVRDLLFEIFPPESDSDWGDVLRRAKRPSPSLRRLTLLVAVVLFAVLAVGSALALSGRLGNLFHGTPVNDLTPRERFLMSEFDMNGKVELIARRKGLAFYVVRRKDGRLCYSIGDVRTHLTPAQREGRFRFGETDCPLGFPSRALPVLNHSYFTYRPGDREARMVGVRGFAANAVARIGVIGRATRSSSRCRSRETSTARASGDSWARGESSPLMTRGRRSGCSAPRSVAARRRSFRAAAAAGSRTRPRRRSLRPSPREGRLRRPSRWSCRAEPPTESGS